MSVFGFLNVDKPTGMTSHDVVAKIRRGLKIKKVGHAGTLDPLATGVLVMCLGGATRLSEYVMHTTKRYQARVRLGVTTDTYDADGETLLERDASAVTREQVEQALTGFMGDIQQVPPMYSAIKQGGRKLYDLARAGEVVEREARSVHISALTVSDWQSPEFTLDVTCGAGTYIRSLAYDIGELLGVGAHLTGLIRSASGDFTLEKASALDTILQDEDWLKRIISPADALTHLPLVLVDADALVHILHGRSIPADEAATPAEVAQGVDSSGQLVAILQYAEHRWLPHKVFLSQD